MPKRLSAALSVLVFAVCLVAGLAAGNTVSTILAHALEGMGATLLIGLALGAMAQKMLDENVKALGKSQDDPGPAAEAVPAGSVARGAMAAQRPAATDRKNSTRKN